MLSRSLSGGGSRAGVHRVSKARGAVLDLPVCERVLGVTSASCWADDDGEEPFRRASEGLLSLTGVAFEVFLSCAAEEAVDMETLAWARGRRAGLGECYNAHSEQNVLSSREPMGINGAAYRSRTGGMVLRSVVVQCGVEFVAGGPC